MEVEVKIMLKNFVRNLIVKNLEHMKKEPKKAAKGKKKKDDE